MDLLAPSGSSLDACHTGWLANYTTHSDLAGGGSYTFGGSGGTSAACANVTGSVALLLSHYHHLDTASFQRNEPEDYQGILKASAWRDDPFRNFDTTKRYSWTDSTGWGHLDIGKAFQMIDPDPTQYPYSGYSLNHFESSDTTKMQFGTWDTLVFVEFAPSYDRTNSGLPDTSGHYPTHVFQLPYTYAKAQFRTVKLTITLPDIWSRSDTAPLFAWGRSGGPNSFSGWNLTSPYNYETGWTQVLNGTGWDADSLNEGIFHNQSTTFVLRTGQWRINLHDSVWMIAPPDSMLGVNFTVFGRPAIKKGVAEAASNPTPHDLKISFGEAGVVEANFYSREAMSDVTVEFFDVLGRSVSSTSVSHVIHGWNRVQSSSVLLTSGTYICRVTGRDYAPQSKTFIIVK